MPPIPVCNPTFAAPSTGAPPACQLMTSADARTALSRPQRAALALIRLYQILISPLFAGSCRFLPSCSDYAAEAVARFGVLRGSWLAARRLGRCHPLCAHGLDPVPAAAGSRLRRDEPRV